MAIVIHTRKGKYRYAYEHTRKGDKVVSRYMYPVNDRGDKIKQYQKEVAQQKEMFLVDNKLRVIHQINDQIFIVEMQGVTRVYDESYKGVDYVVFKNPLNRNSYWSAIDKRTGLSLIYQDKEIKTRKECIDLVHKNFDRMGDNKDINKGLLDGINKVNQYWNDERVNKVIHNESKYDYKKDNAWEDECMLKAGYIKTGDGVYRKEVAQQTNIDTEIEEMEAYAALHTKKVRKKHTFKKCPVCGSTNIRIIDLRPLGHKNSSQCKECGHTL